MTICKNVQYGRFLGWLYKTKNVLGNKVHENSGEDSISREKQLSICPWPLGESCNENGASACWLSNVDPLLCQDKFQGSVLYIIHTQDSS